MLEKQTKKKHNERKTCLQCFPVWDFHLLRWKQRDLKLIFFFLRMSHVPLSVQWNHYCVNPGHSYAPQTTLPIKSIALMTGWSTRDRVEEILRALRYVHSECKMNFKKSTFAYKVKEKMWAGTGLLPAVQTESWWICTRTHFLGETLYIFMLF